MSTNHSNRIVIASAGSRKTTEIVKEALAIKGDNILILTYTIENINQIRSYIIRNAGLIPPNITIQTWYTFLLQECVRPYQNYCYKDKRIETIYFPEDISAFKISRRYIKKENIKSYFLVKGKYLINEHASEFACICNSNSGGKMITRLEEIYSKIFIDEVQDLSGYDFDVLELLLNSKINCYLVGDCRQATYFTSCSPKYKKFKGYNIIKLFKEWEKYGLCLVTEKNECYRSNKPICDFADKLYPELNKTTSFNHETTEHDGVFFVKPEQVHEYIDRFKPVVLRYNRLSNTLGFEGLNFGTTKGQTFERVFIFPTEPIKKYLKTGDYSVLPANTRAKLYVAITRAKSSVAFLYEGEFISDEINQFN